MAITWGYQDFPANTNQAAALNKMLTDAAKKGLQFISDRDARAAGGLHPYAHLWDNGNNPVAELKAVNKVREYHLPYPPSSPAIALFKNGELVSMVERHHIEGTPAQVIAQHLISVFKEHCN